MATNFNDIFSAAGQTAAANTKTSPSKKKTPPNPTTKADPWGGIDAPEKQATVRLNVDIDISLNEKLAAKAREKGVPKTELVRKLLEWALE